METAEQAPPTANGSAPAETSPAETQTPSEMFKFSRYVHIGPGAEDCEEGEDGSCANPLHFHAWIRLPNQFQHASIREKALAAKARKLRQLREPDSDARAILDSELDEIVTHGDRDALVEEIVNKDFFRDHLRAMRDVGDREEFKHIEEDRERLRVLQGQATDERNEEEYEELSRHHKAYMDAVEQERSKIQQPLRDSVADKSIEELREIVFEERIQREAQEEFNRTYSLWEWYIATMKPKPKEKGLPSERVFGDVNHLKAAAPEVIEALDAAFTEIESEAGRQMRGF